METFSSFPKFVSRDREGSLLSALQSFEPPGVLQTAKGLVDSLGFLFYMVRIRAGFSSIGCLYLQLARKPKVVGRMIPLTRLFENVAGIRDRNIPLGPDRLLP